MALVPVLKAEANLMLAARVADGVRVLPGLNAVGFRELFGVRTVEGGVTGKRQVREAQCLLRLLKARDPGCPLEISSGKNAAEEEVVSVIAGPEFVGLTQSEHGDTVTATFEAPDGSLEEVQAAYLIDSEGAHSIIRTTFNLQFSGKTRGESHVLGDLFIDGDLPDTDFHIFSSEHGFMRLFPMGRHRSGWLPAIHSQSRAKTPLTLSKKSQGSTISVSTFRRLP